MTYNVNLRKAVGNGYRDFLSCKKRYIAVKGSRGSKKSCTTALKIIYNMMKYSPLKPNTLVIRRYDKNHKNSTRAQLIWAIYKLGVSDLWKIPKGENTLTYIPTGQQILFRGLDDPLSITSITVEQGYLCWVWFEEAFQIQSEDDFNKIDMSIRGQLPEGLFKQLILTFNPWSDKHWLKKRFFDNPSDDILAITTTYTVNEFLGEDDLKVFDKMKEQNPKRYRIEGLGEWGISEGLVYDNWDILDFDINQILSDNSRNVNFVPINGMDFGYNDPTAFVGAYADKKKFEIWLYYEFYAATMSNHRIAGTLITDGFQKSLIIADSEDPRTINELRLLGLSGIRGCKKGAGSVLGGIQRLQDYKIHIHPSCVHAIESFSNYAWKKDRLSDKITNEPEHDFSHLCDALRYASEGLPRFGVKV